MRDIDNVNAVNKKFEEEDASEDGAQGVVPASADLTGLLEHDQLAHLGYFFSPKSRSLVGPPEQKSAAKVSATVCVRAAISCRKVALFSETSDGRFGRGADNCQVSSARGGVDGCGDFPRICS